MACYSPARGYKAKNGAWVSKKPTDTAPVPMNVPCGGCLGCRDTAAKHWAARIVHEASLYKYNCFLTLTYRDKDTCTPKQLAKQQHLPDDGSLVKSHFQKFMKRLRHHLRGRRVRYYQCGEYGDENERPHYHACLFNLRFDDEQLYRHNHGNPLFTSQTLEDLWGYGFATIGQLTYESAAYTARYVFKKVTGLRADDHYLRYDQNGNAYWLLPEYTTMSRKPGIGYDWYQRYKDDIFPSDDLPIPGRGTMKGAPRYYHTILQNEDLDQYETVQAVRKKFAEEHGDEYSLQRLEAKFKCHHAGINHLRRDL